MEKMPEKLTIAIAMLSENGHYTGTFRLARKLRSRGHRIIYIGIADFEDNVKAQGFEFLSFAPDLLPKGYTAKFAAAQSNLPRGWRSWRRKRRNDEKTFKAYLRRLTDGRLDELLLSCGPDLLLCDTFVWYVAIRALKLKIPAVSISIILSLFRNPLIPPIIFSLPPGRTWWSSCVVRWAWAWMRFKFFFTKRMASRFLGSFRFPTRMHHLLDVFIEIAKASGYPCVENSTYWYGEMGPRIIQPEIVLCPRAFQFPRKPEDGRLYLGYPVDTERSEELLEEGSIDRKKPVVFCSLGSSAFFYPHARRFFNAVVGASRIREDWQFILHTGDYQGADKLGPHGTNLLIRQRVPQLAILREASVMVTHGGLNSIMEGIHFGVPMVIVPGMRDQPGNAARALYHGIGLASSMARITPEKLVKMISDAMDNDEIKKALSGMQQKISEEQDENGAVQFMESRGRKYCQ